MGVKTKIDWCDSSWNPVTGCLHGCEYCYARRIAKRFSCEGQTLDAPPELQRVWLMDGGADLRQKGCHVLRYPVRLLNGRKCPYPFGFAPTLHRYKLDEPQKWKKPRTIFVCSMADLFGEWVPDAWIEEVFDACAKAPQHRYLFLTKNPRRYTKLLTRYTSPNMWFGWSQTGPFESSMEFEVHHSVNTFVSIEPILRPIDRMNFKAEWMIVGAETGNRKGKIVPEKEWVNEIIQGCHENGTPIFMKESLREIMGDDFRQEFPWEV